jgi:hypothetical protein
MVNMSEDKDISTFFDADWKSVNHNQGDAVKKLV